jgi:hypothetical protein
MPDKQLPPWLGIRRLWMSKIFGSRSEVRFFILVGEGGTGQRRGNAIGDRVGSGGETRTRCQVETGEKVQWAEKMQLEMAPPARRNAVRMFDMFPGEWRLGGGDLGSQNRETWTFWRPVSKLSGFRCKPLALSPKSRHRCRLSLPSRYRTVNYVSHSLSYGIFPQSSGNFSLSPGKKSR